MSPVHPRLIETLRDAQRFGFFGAGPIEVAVEHAQAYVAAIGSLPAGCRLIDLGSGGGLPGLVLADAYPAAEIVLLDRRQKRTDFLRRAATRLGFDHVTVVAGEADDLVRRVAAGQVAPYDVVTARGFGPPAVTLATAAGLAAADGRIVISEPPTGDRWDARQVAALGLERVRHGSVSVFGHRV